MRAAVYVRQSLDRASDGLAVGRQREDCLALVARRGWELARIYEDNDVSASSGKRRPGYLALLEDLRAGHVDVVVAWASDRLHRRLAELVEFVAVVNEAGALVATVHSGDVDLATPHGRMLAGILGSVAQAEVEQKGLRQQRANQQRAQAGVPRFTRRPYGYAADGRTVVESEAAVIRRSAAAVLAGSSLRDQVRQLNQQGAVSSVGNEWNVTSLRRTLSNPRMAGLNVYKGELVGAGQWLPILSEATHHALVTLFANPERRLSPGNARKYLLSGLLRCGVCGDPMYASSSGTPARSWMIYRCRRTHNSRRLDLVDATVEAVVMSRLQRFDVAELLAPAAADSDTEALRLEASALRHRLDEAASLFAAGILTSGQLQTISAEVRSRLVAVERQQADAGRGHVLADLVHAIDVKQTWQSLPLSRKRAVIDTLLEATVLPVGKGQRFRPEQVAVTWR